MKIKALRHLPSAVFLMIGCGSCIALAAQTPDAVPAAAPVAALQTKPSALVQPAIATLQQTLEVLRPDKWKASDGARQEAAANVISIRRDLDGTLPTLLSAADAAPNSVSRLLPAYRNIEALYDVLLRVVGTGNLAAPNQQSAALERARTSLEDAQRSLGDRIKSTALSQEQQIHNLQVALHAVPPVPAPVVCPTPAPVKKPKRRHRKPAAKPTTSVKPTTSPQTNGTPAAH
jgi:hypothetical protein